MRFLPLLLAFLCTTHLAAQDPTNTTRRIYLSGTDAEHTRTWDFYCSGGQQSGKWHTIEVPSCWELQGYGEYTYGRFYKTKGLEPSTETLPHHLQDARGRCLQTGFRRLHDRHPRMDRWPAGRAPTASTTDRRFSCPPSSSTASTTRVRTLPSRTCGATGHARRSLPEPSSGPTSMRPYAAPTPHGQVSRQTLRPARFQHQGLHPR